MHSFPTKFQQTSNAIKESAIELHSEARYVVSDSAASDRILPVFFLLVFSVPFEWLRLSWLGDRSVLLLPFFLMIANIAMTPITGINRLQRFFGLAPWIHGAYFAYLAALTSSAFWGPNPSTGVTELGRAWSLFGFYLIVGTYLIDTPSASVARTLLFAVPLSLVAFVVYSNYVFRAQGDSLLNQLSLALSSGDSNAIGRRVLRNVITFHFASTAGPARDEITASVRNTISAAIMLFLIMMWVYAASIYRRRWSSWHTVSLALTTIVVPVLLLVLMSRSSLILMGLSPVVCLIVYNASSRGMLNRSLGWTTIVVLLAAGAGSFLMTKAGDSQLISKNVQRMDEISGDARVQHYHLVFREIQRQPLLGYGMGAETPDRMSVHNMFLGAWFRAGAAGLLCSVLFYLFLLGRWIRDVNWIMHLPAQIPNIPNLLLLPALLVEPLTRTPLIGGQDGRYIRVEWMAIACFLTIVHEVQTRHEKMLVLHVD